MNLGKIRGAVEKADHFEVDAGDGAPFKVAKSALSEQLVDKVRRLYCGGKVENFADGGTVPMPMQPLPRPRYGSANTPDLAELYNLPGENGLTPAQEQEWAEAQPDLAAVFRTPGPDGETPEQAQARVAAGRGSSTTIPVIMPDLGRVAPDLAAEFRKPGPDGETPEQAQARVAKFGIRTDVDVPELEEETPATAGQAPPPPTAPATPSAADVMAEARAAGTAAARKIAEAGDLARRSLEERSAAEAQARAAEYNAAAALVQTQDEAARRAELEAERLRETYQRGQNAMRLQREKLAQREKDLGDTENMRIESGRVFSRTDPVGLIMGAMMVGAAEAGLRKGSGSEAALKVIGDAIDRDVLAQKAEIEGVRSARLRAYEAAVGDVNNAAQLLKADQQLVAAAAARAEAQRTQSAQGRLMLTKLASDLSTQARQTADEAVKLLTGQAIAEQKAAADAEGRQVALRQAEASLARGQADLAAADRAELRGEEQLAMAREKLGLEKQAQEFGQAVTLAQLRAKTGADGGKQSALKGALGGELVPEEFAAIDDSKERSHYVVVPSKATGEVVYRRARSEADATRATKLFGALDEAMGAARDLDKLIAKPGFTPERILPGTKAKARSEQLQKKILLTLKDVRELGALTGADLELVEPFIPDPQSWSSTDAQEAEQMQQLQRGFQTLRALAEEKLLMARPGQRPVLSERAQ